MVTNYKTGLDIGSTTVKIAVLCGSGNLIWSRDVRHNARIAETISVLLEEASSFLGDAETTISLTGSIGMGVAECCALPFTQEVVAAARAVRQEGSRCRTLIDIGGEDAKVTLSLVLDGKMSYICVKQ